MIFSFRTTYTTSWFFLVGNARTTEETSLVSTKSSFHVQRRRGRISELLRWSHVQNKHIGTQTQQVCYSPLKTFFKSTTIYSWYREVHQPKYITEFLLFVDTKKWHHTNTWNWKRNWEQIHDLLNSFKINKIFVIGKTVILGTICVSKIAI